MSVTNFDLNAAKIRLDILKMLQHRGYGHMGGSLSIVEVLSVLYTKHLKHDPKNPMLESRDYMVLSKGHAGPALYATLANFGFFDKDILLTLNDGGTILPSHPDRLKTPGVDMTTGSLGQGISVAGGIAKGFKMKNMPNYVYSIVGDGELNEGQCWEAFQFIAHNRLDNLIVFIDDNKKQLDGTTNEIINPFDIVKKMEAFGFNVQKVNGNDCEAIDQAINKAKQVKNEAICIVLDTIKGQGVPYFETLDANHSVKFGSNDIDSATNEAISKLETLIKECE